MRVEIPMQLSNKEEVFAHCDNNGIHRLFPSGFMYKFARKYARKTEEIVTGAIELSLFPIDSIAEKMGIEEARLKRLKSPYLEMPIVCIFWEGNEQITIIDGNHRVVKLARMGRLRIKAYIFKYGTWQQFVLPVAPEHMRFGGESGILAKEKAARQEGVAP